MGRQRPGPLGVLQYDITGDRAWLARAYPAMKKAVEWTMAPAAGRRPTRRWPACCPPLPPTASACGTANTTSWATISGICAACFDGRSGRLLGRMRAMPTLLAGRRSSTAMRSTPPGNARGSPISRPVGRRTARTGAISNALAHRDLRSRRPAHRRHGAPCPQESNGGFIEGTMQWLGDQTSFIPMPEFTR